ncbi:hypothetical protein XBJ2_60060 [Xenorhabdus bovienii str. Jollieti]|nr:hypothetical protein XBJ2_60060 [Xenorhabdus bovienii str. Jollieti]
MKLLTHLRMGPFPAHLRRQMTLDKQITDCTERLPGLCLTKVQCTKKVQRLDDDG